MQTGSSGTLIGWKSGQTTFVPLWDRMEGAWLYVHVVPPLGFSNTLRNETRQHQHLLISEIVYVHVNTAAQLVQAGRLLYTNNEGNSPPTSHFNKYSNPIDLFMI
jgi:hypothetical protein